ncbi:hypothetical protein NIES4075_40180 [Tolypothrix sp. NIES-4075]|uniref:phosphoribosyltransferase n=1 Tax=Tolypothrix sp. NIES-4075 TaxID=2005459 RepID=UPI000B5CAD16|nr:phosphoribosyltransferase family protein [Tolypothrix sp. NIES-4075]GAX43009.1 hypothetical protein NIES4075_40180 [Tolypothrix sp. NIES-4075]
MKNENISLWKKQKLIVIDWHTLGEYLEDIASSIVNSSSNPTTIASISRGGLILGTYLSNVLGIRDFYILSISRNLTNQKFSTRQEPEFLWIAPEPTQLIDKHVLIADDIVGDGGTLSLAIDVLQSKGAASVSTAAIVKNQNSKYEPDFFKLTVDDWVVFPWEPKVNSTSLSENDNSSSENKSSVAE